MQTPGPEIQHRRKEQATRTTTRSLERTFRGLGIPTAKKSPPPPVLGGQGLQRRQAPGNGVNDAKARQNLKFKLIPKGVTLSLPSKAAT